MIVCRHCGQELMNDAVFCFKCGEKVKKAPAMIVCMHCGQELMNDAVFCFKCGEKVKKTPVTVVCSNCGTLLAEESIFCSKCGQKVPKNVPVGTPVKVPAPLTDEEIWESLRDHALLYYRMGDYKASLDLWLQMRDINERDMHVLYNIGECYREMNDFEHAERFYLLAGGMGSPDGLEMAAHLFFIGSHPEWTIKRVDNPQRACGLFLCSLVEVDEKDTENIWKRLNYAAICFNRMNNPFRASLCMWTACLYTKNQIAMDNFKKFSAGLNYDQLKKVRSIRNRKELLSFMRGEIQ